MAWIESHQEISRHPKTLVLATTMGWTIREAVGAVHIFWHWCVDYAEDGDLRRYNDAILAVAVGLNPTDGKRFVEAMTQCGGSGVASGFIDREPYFRVHDWWQYIGTFLRRKYNKQPSKWQRIMKLYEKGVIQDDTPNLTQPNLNTKDKPSAVDKSEAKKILEPDPWIPVWLKANWWLKKRGWVHAGAFVGDAKKAGYLPEDVIKTLVSLEVALEKIPELDNYQYAWGTLKKVYTARMQGESEKFKRADLSKVGDVLRNIIGQR